MLKSFIILLFSFGSLFAVSLIETGDKHYYTQNYLEAIKYYKEAKVKKDEKADLKLIMSYLKLGDNFLKIRDFKKAISYYNKAVNLDSPTAKLKLSKVYETQADQFLRVKKYKTAYNLYQKSLNLGNKTVSKKLRDTKKHIDHQKNLKDDTRKIVDKTAPSWTKSIGRIIVPTKLEFVTAKRYKTDFKKCTATLVNIDEKKSSNIVVTASHCLTKYKKEAGDIRFIIKANNGDMIQRIAKVVYDSRYSHRKLKTVSDYAILKLDSKISIKLVKPMKIVDKSFSKLKKEYRYSFASLAGFSGDIGDFGAQLTYDPECSIFTFDKVYGYSNCKGFKGASGGPVVLSATNDNKKFDYYFVGVVSHFRDKNFKNIYFAPLDIFYNKVKLYF